MDDLQKVLETNLAERRKELKKAAVIVQEEVRDFISWLKTLDLVPTIVSLRDRAEKIRCQEMDKAFSMLKTTLTDKQKQTIDAMSRAIVNKILHDPIYQLKEAPDTSLCFFSAYHSGLLFLFCLLSHRTTEPFGLLVLLAG